MNFRTREILFTDFGICYTFAVCGSTMMPQQFTLYNFTEGRKK